MSGGSMDYLCYTVERAADDIGNSKSHLRRAFARHLSLVAKALHDIEWVDSGDYPEGGEDKAIKAALGDNVGERSLDSIKEEIKEMIKNLKTIIE